MTSQCREIALLRFEMMKYILREKDEILTKNIFQQRIVDSPRTVVRLSREVPDSFYKILLIIFRILILITFGEITTKLQYALIWHNYRPRIGSNKIRCFKKARCFKNIFFDVPKKTVSMLKHFFDDSKKSRCCKKNSMLKNKVSRWPASLSTQAPLT